MIPLFGDPMAGGKRFVQRGQPGHRGLGVGEDRFDRGLTLRFRRGELGDRKVVYVHPAGLSSFQWPSETTSTLPSVTLMAV